MSRFWQLFLIRKHLLAAWLPVMALHEANQARSSHYPQWHCGPKLHLLATNDILHLLGKHSTTSPQRAHRHQSGQRSDVLPRYRLVPCKRLIVLRMRPRHQATLTQPLQCDLQRLSCKTQKNYSQRRRQLQLQNRILTPKRRKDDFEALFKRTFEKENY